ncbi:SMI1/KNR4 family protein [Catenulispora subtropica]|uniref:Knr4/Smi1-like domain-containing protein n=1 Tax=Catenulispora subtropica TaxID=450798 RepID=A0ABN2SVG7_9ACTN
MTDSEVRIAGATRAAVDSPDRAAVWDLIKIVAADWSARPLGPRDGCPEEELDAAAVRLGLPLPAALREAFQLFGRRDDLTRNQDPFSTPGDLDLYEGALVFREENQGVCWWGVLLEDLGQDDPPTYLRSDMADKSQEHWTPWTDRLSLALAEMVLAETVLEDTEDLTDGTDFSPGILEDLGLRPLPSLAPAWCETGFHVGPDLLAHVSGGSWISVRGRTPEALAAFSGDEDSEDEE